MLRARLAGRLRPLLLPGAALLASVAGCHTGAAQDVSPAAIRRDPGWLLVGDVPLVRQRSESDCGAAALAMMLAYWDSPTGLEEITAAVPGAREQGIAAGQLRDFARAQGLQAYVIAGQVPDLVSELRRRRPVLVGLAKPTGGGKTLSHYEVVIGVHKERRLILTLDPAHGWRQSSLEAFARQWVPTGQVTVVIFRGGD